MSEQHSRLAVILCAVILSSSARADIQFSSVGILGADSQQKFAGMGQYGVLLGYRVSSWSKIFWMPNRLDFSARWLERGSNASAFVSAGPARIRCGRAQLLRPSSNMLWIWLCAVSPVDRKC